MTFFAQYALRSSLLVLVLPLLLTGLVSCSGGQFSQVMQGSEAEATQSSAKSSFNPFSPEEKPTLAQRRANAGTPTVVQLMKPAGGLEERYLGKRNAPVTVIEYASLTCPVCRKFHVETFPAFKRKYINTGKVRYIIREFPIGHASGAATIAMRCAKNSRDYFRLYDAYLSKQRLWVGLKVRYNDIYRVAKKTVGMSRKRFDACINDKALVASLNAIKQQGRDFGVIGTPSFFVNGRPLRGAKTLAEMDSVIRAALSGKVAGAQ